MILLGFEDGDFGIYDFFFFFNGVFMLNFLGFMNLVSGFMNFICWRFHG